MNKASELLQIKSPSVLTAHLHNYTHSHLAATLYNLYLLLLATQQLYRKLLEGKSFACEQPDRKCTESQECPSPPIYSNLVQLGQYSTISLLTNVWLTAYKHSKLNIVTVCLSFTMSVIL